MPGEQSTLEVERYPGGRRYLEVGGTSRGRRYPGGRRLRRSEVVR